MKTLNLKTIAIVMTTLASCSQNEPEMPVYNNTTPSATSDSYTAIARLSLNDSIVPFIESIQVIYTLPGQAEQTETLSLRKMQSSDLEAEAIAAKKMDINECSIAAFEKRFSTRGEVKMQLVVNVDTLRPVYADTYDVMILPIIAAGKTEGNEMPQCNVQVSIAGGLQADHLMECLVRRTSAMSEKTFNL